MSNGRKVARPGGSSKLNHSWGGPGIGGRVRQNVSNPDPGGVKRTVKKPKKRFP
jgi:hypothetical protein